jgi:hypothetical protein
MDANPFNCTLVAETHGPSRHHPSVDRLWSDRGLDNRIRLHSDGASEVKDFQSFRQIAQIGSRPLSFAFYGLVVICSTLLTLGIISINGFVEVLTKESERPTGIREASAAIIIAIVFKILAWDYLLALKSFVLLRLLRVKIETKRGPRRVLGTIPGMIAVFLDFFVTVMLTERVFHWWLIFQTQHEKALPQGVAEALGFSMP